MYRANVFSLLVFFGNFNAMSKLPKQNQFLDLSDYGRPIAKLIANSLRNTSFTPIHVTVAFIVSGLIAIACLIYHYYWATAFFLVLKSILDAADGELARIKKTHSYTGRYLDSVSDIILNLLILITIWYVTNGSLLLALLAFFGLQLQGTLYNYYYVILRNKHNGDTTSRVFEEGTPIALKGEKQSDVNVLFGLYSIISLIIFSNCRLPFFDGINFSNWLVNIPNPNLSLFFNARNISDTATSKLKSSFDFINPKFVLADKSKMR